MVICVTLSVKATYKFANLRGKTPSVDPRFSNVSTFKFHPKIQDKDIMSTPDPETKESSPPQVDGDKPLEKHGQVTAVGAAAAAVETPQASKYSYWSIFRFASAFDFLLIFIGTLAAIVNGTTLPFMPVIFGDVINSFVRPNNPTIREDVATSVIYMCYIGVVSFVTSYIQMSLWMIVGENISKVGITLSCEYAPLSYKITLTVAYS